VSEVSLRVPVAPPPRRGSSPYYGPTFCSSPTIGARNPRFPNGRINSGRAGGGEQAIIDINLLAMLNGIAPPREVFVERRILQAASRSPVPFPVGAGWTVSIDPISNYISMSNRGLTARFNQRTGDYRIDIPAGFIVTGGVRLPVAETCHYR